jgi:hypothetical protein
MTTVIKIMKPHPGYHYERWRLVLLAQNDTVFTSDKQRTIFDRQTVRRQTDKPPNTQCRRQEPDSPDGTSS